MISFFLHVGHLFVFANTILAYTFCLIAGVPGYRARHLGKSSIRWPAIERIPVFENPKGVLYIILLHSLFSCP